MTVSRMVGVIAGLGLTWGLASVSATPDLRLVDAVRTRDSVAAAALLKQRVDVNARQADGATALHWAAHWNDLKTAEALIRAGAQVNAANKHGVTPLWLASLNGSSALVELLLRAGANPNAALNFGETPLMTAARSGSVETVKALLTAGAEVNARETTHGQTALMWAAAEKHLDVMRLLVEHGADVARGSDSGFTPLMFVAREGDFDAARLLLSKGVDVNAAWADGTTALLVATIRGHVDFVELLLNHGANPNAVGAGHTALHWAAGTWETEFINAYQLKTGEWAALGGIPSRDEKERLIKMLVARGADVNARATKFPERAGYSILGDGAWPRGATPFFIAAVGADTATMRLLAGLGADPRLPLEDGTTPLMAAAGILRIDNETKIPERQHFDATVLALELGNDVAAVTANGETALHGAAWAGFDSVTQYLVDHGADVNAKTKRGRTPLAIATFTDSHAQVVMRPSTAALLRKLGGVDAPDAPTFRPLDNYTADNPFSRKNKDEDK